MQLDRACPTMSGYFLGADWAAQSGLMVSWPTNDVEMKDQLPRVQQAVSLLVRSLAEFAPVLIVAPKDHAAEVRLACRDRAEILTVEAATDQPGLYGPWFLTDGTNGHALLTWQGKQARAAAQHAAIFQSDCFDAPLNIDGRVVVSNGAGTLLASEAGLLAQDRNPELTLQQIEERMALFLGARHVIWLGGGLAVNQEGLTGAVRFTGTNHAIVAEAPEGDAEKFRLDAIAMQIANEQTADHVALEVTRTGIEAGYGPLSAVDYVHTADKVLVASLPEGAALSRLERAVGKPVLEIAVDPALALLGGLNAIVRPLPPAAFVPKH